MSACEKHIDIDFEDQQQKVVVKSDNCVGEDISIALTLSRPVYGSFYVREGEDYFPKVTDASVTLGVGDMQLSATREGNVYSFAHQPQPGEELALWVEVPGHEVVTATATVPYPPTVSNVELSSHGNDDLHRDVYGETLRFSLADNANSTDFYNVRVHRFDTAVYTYIDTAGAVMAVDTSIDDYYTAFECVDYMLVSNTDLDNMMDPEDPDATATYYGNNMLFTDASINGRNHDLTLSIIGRYYDYYEGHKNENVDYDAMDHVNTEFLSTIVLEVSTLTKDLYLYKQTVRTYDDDEFLAFFSEPVQIHSNICGGIGIFGMHAVTKYRLTVNE